MAHRIDYELVGGDMQAGVITLDPGEAVRAEVGAMMFMDASIQMQTSTGGEGFVLQRLEGDGLAFVHAGGTIIQKDLEAGESVRVDTGFLSGQ